MSMEIRHKSTQNHMCLHLLTFYRCKLCCRCCRCCGCCRFSFAFSYSNIMYLDIGVSEILYALIKFDTPTDIVDVCRCLQACAGVGRCLQVLQALPHRSNAYLEENVRIEHKLRQYSFTPKQVLQVSLINLQNWPFERHS